MSKNFLCWVDWQQENSDRPHVVGRHSCGTWVCHVPSLQWLLLSHLSSWMWRSVHLSSLRPHPCGHLRLFPVYPHSAKIILHGSAFWVDLGGEKVVTEHSVDMDCSISVAQPLTFIPFMNPFLNTRTHEHICKHTCEPTFCIHEWICFLSLRMYIGSLWSSVHRSHKDELVNFMMCSQPVTSHKALRVVNKVFLQLI